VPSACITPSCLHQERLHDEKGRCRVCSCTGFIRDDLTARAEAVRLSAVRDSSPRHRT
jgi:hypothetical protein